MSKTSPNMPDQRENQPVILSPQPTLPSDALGLNLNLSPTPLPSPSQILGKRLARSWSVNGLEEYLKQNPAPLPGLLAASFRTNNKRKFNAQHAAIRAATMHVKRRDQRLERDSQMAASSQKRTEYPPFYPENRPSHSQPFASGPITSVPDELQRSNTPSGLYHNRHATPEGERSPIYLIRTDLRYSPTHDTVVASLELPGMRQEDVQLRLGSRSSGIRHLIITAHSRRPQRVTGEVAMQERMYGTFTRTLIVPPHVMANDIQAEMRDGLLILKIPGTKFEDVVITQTKKEPVKPEIV